MTTEPATIRPRDRLYDEMLDLAGEFIGPPEPAPIREDLGAMVRDHGADIAVQKRRTDALVLMLEFMAGEIDKLRQAQHPQ